MNTIKHILHIAVVATAGLNLSVLPGKAATIATTVLAALSYLAHLLGADTTTTTE